MSAQRDLSPAMQAYVQSLDGALTPEEHERLERWVDSETVRRRWRLTGDIHAALAADLRETPKPKDP
jgi:phosphodiesterase/alkaline phosphatase D-like protein